MGVHGKKASFKLDDASGVLTDISQYLNNISFPRTKEKAQDTGFGANSHTYVVGLMDATISITGRWSPTVDAILGALAAPGQDQTLSFEYSPAGTGSGMPKYSGECYLESYDPPADLGDALTFTASFQVTGNVTRSTHT